MTGKHILAQADEIVCHNIVGYDLVLWLKCGLIDSFTVGPDSINGRKVKITDSLVLSRYINPDRIGGHGLEAWGERIGVAKPKQERIHCSGWYPDRIQARRAGGCQSIPQRES